MKSTAPPRLEFSQLVARHHEMVWRYLRLLGCESALAEDLTQETFLGVWQDTSRPQSGRPLGKVSGAYLRVVARNKFIDEMRRRRYVVNGQIERAEAAWHEIAGDDDGAAWRTALSECLQHLAERPRRILDLRYRDKHPIGQIAITTGMKESGVKTLLGRVKQKLRECIERKVNR